MPQVGSGKFLEPWRNAGSVRVALFHPAIVPLGLVAPGAPLIEVGASIDGWITASSISEPSSESSNSSIFNEPCARAISLFLISPNDCAGSIDEVVSVRFKKPVCFSGVRGGLYGLAHFLNYCFGGPVFTDSRALVSRRGPFPWPCLQWTALPSFFEYCLIDSRFFLFLPWGFAGNSCATVSIGVGTPPFTSGARNPTAWLVSWAIVGMKFLLCASLLQIGENCSSPQVVMQDVSDS